VDPVVEEKGHHMPGSDPGQHHGIGHDLPRSEQRDDDEPDQRDGPEHRTHAGGPAPLQQEDPDQDEDRERNHEVPE